MKKILSLISVCVFITGTASSAVACNLWPVTQKDNTYDSIDLAIRSLLNTRINVPEINSENKEKINEYVTDIILQELSKKEYRDPEIKFNKDLLTEISFIDIATKKNISSDDYLKKRKVISKVVRVKGIFKYNDKYTVVTKIILKTVPTEKYLEETINNFEMIEEDTLLNIVKTKDNSLDKIKTNLKNIIFKKINKYITIDREKFSIENIEINYDNKKISKTPIVNEDLQKTNNQLITIKFKYKDYTFPYNQNLKMTVITKLKNNEKMIENKEIKIEKTPTQDIVLSTEIKQEEKAIVKIKDKIKEETPTQEIVVSTETKDKEETPLEKDIEKIEEITNKETLLKAQEEKTTEETIKLITPKTSV